MNERRERITHRGAPRARLFLALWHAGWTYNDALAEVDKQLPRFGPPIRRSK